MTPVTTSHERRVAKALIARAGGETARPPEGRPVEARAAVSGRANLRTALVLALLGGAVLGMVLALLSLLTPGVLPPVG